MSKEKLQPYLPLVIIDGGNCGMLAVKMDRQLITDLAMELIEMVETYGD